MYGSLVVNDNVGQQLDKQKNCWFFDNEKLREESGYQIGWFFGKVPKGEGGSFSIKKIILQILGTLKRAFWSENCNWKKIVISGFRVCFFNNYIEKHQNNTYFEEGPSSHNSLRDGSRYQIRWFFGKVPNGRMVSISGNHVNTFHTISPSYLLAYLQPYLS